MLTSLGAHPGDALKQSGRSATSGRSAYRLRSGLVILEAALSLVLLIGAALLIRSFAAVLATPPGFDPAGVTIVRTSFNRHRYAAATHRHSAEREIVDRLRHLPGVTQVSLTTHIPIADERGIGFVIEGRDLNDYHWADNANVDANYFRTMCIRIAAGRSFHPQDAAASPVAVINQTMARQFWRQGDALGKRFLWGGTPRPYTVIGIANDVHLEALDLTPKPTIYMDVYQSALTDAVFVLRAPRKGVAELGAELVRSSGQSIPACRCLKRPAWRTSSNHSLAARRFTVLVLACFASLALGLASNQSLRSSGVHGHAADPRIRYSISARRRSQEIVLEIAGSGIRLALAGLLFGSVAGALLAKSMSRLLFGVQPLDLFSFVMAAGALLIAGAWAATIPALRASRVDPMSALRCE